MLAAFCAAATALLPLGQAARACGFHDPASVNLGLLNLAYPDALHVRTAVWMAQRDALVPSDVRPSHDPSSVEHRLEAMRRYRDAVAGLDALRERMRPMDGTPRFAVVLVGSMLWTRFEPSGDRVAMTPHSTGPRPDDVVVVTDAPVVRALLDGTLSPADAQARGLVRLYGPTRPRAGVASLLDRLRAPAPAASDVATPRDAPSGALVRPHPSYVMAGTP